jgi:hypothetical protein
MTWARQTGDSWHAPCITITITITALSCNFPRVLAPLKWFVQSHPVALQLHAVACARRRSSRRPRRRSRQPQRLCGAPLFPFVARFVFSDYWTHAEDNCGSQSMKDLWRINAT